MTVPSYNTQIVAQGLARLTGVFGSQPAIRAWLSVCLQPWQDLEDATWGVLTGRFLSTATIYALPQTNPVLDVLGSIVGQPRGGMSDADYSPAISLRIAINRSTGRITDWSRFATIILGQFATGPVKYYDDAAGTYFGIWNFNASSLEVNVPNIVGGMLSSAEPNGVRGTFAYSTWADGNDFEYGSVYDGTAGQGTYGSVYDGTVGGLLVAGVEM